MTSEGSDGVLHFRGKTLTPESPRPIHISEPSNILVLENQTDPVFNDTSTYNVSDVKEEGSSNPISEIEDPIHLAKHTFSRTLELFRAGDATLGSTVVGGQGDHVESTQHNAAKQGANGSGPPIDHDAIANTANPYASSVRDDHFPQDDSSMPQGSNLFPKSALVPDNVSISSHPQPHQLQNITMPTTVSAPARPSGSVKDGSNMNNDGGAERQSESEVNFDSLLDNLLQPTVTIPTVASLPSTIDPSNGHATSMPLMEGSPLSHPSSLPPQQTPQAIIPSTHPSHSLKDDVQLFHSMHSQLPHESPQHFQSDLHAYPSHSKPSEIPEPSSHQASLSFPPGTTIHRHSHSTTFSNSGSTHLRRRSDHEGELVARSPYLARDDDDSPWGPEVQKKYDEFLREEREYVTEGAWDRFPSGSRLFIGNLPSERVTKRDLFHVFHKYGKIAQISIKQAYGFVQFADSTPCRDALEGRQGSVVRGRRIHLEISKPQKSLSEAHRRSKSPEYGWSREIGWSAPRQHASRYDRTAEAGRLPFSDFRDPHHRRRDREDYRQTRSPSPRGFRGANYRSRDRSVERYNRRDRRRSRSPFSRGRHRSPTPKDRPHGHEVGPEPPILKRHSHQVPDVQVIVLDDIDRTVIYRIESIFRDRNLKTDVLILNARSDLASVIHQQIIEGVLAIVRLSNSSQYSGKISLQVFDRSRGANDVQFNEYSELAPHVAADVVLHSRNLQSANGPPRPANPPSQQPPQPMAAAPAGQDDLVNMISSLDAPTLQKLLGALQQQSVPATPVQVTQPYSITNPPHPTDLASLLANYGRQNPGVPAPLIPVVNNPLIPPHSLAAPMMNMPLPPPPPPAEPNIAAILAHRFAPQTPNQQLQPSPQVQNIMSQLAKRRQ